MFDFTKKELFIYDLANNHQGDMEHAIKIIETAGQITRELGIQAILKFQFRQLDTFIHPDYQDRTDIKFIKRFSETKLSMDDFKILADLVKENGMMTMSTPFDEASVGVIEDMGLDFIKVASCSANDKPLLKRIAKSNLPVVASTAGLRMDEVDWLVSFFQSKNVNFALMHCVALYPTPDEKLGLNQLDMFKERYPSISIGYSTHEDQDNFAPVQIACAKGAMLFERHIGIPTDEYQLNAYSSNPAQLKNWLQAFKHAKKMCGNYERVPSSLNEYTTLRDLKRGVFVKKDVAKGELLTEENIFFAMPTQDGQLISGDYFEGMIADKDYLINEAVSETLMDIDESHDQIIYSIMLQVKSLLRKSHIPINAQSSIEISHHYGLERFREFGAVIITCINREYAKKIVVQLPRQKHPYHLHKKKEETFQLLAGDLEIVTDGEANRLSVGDTCLIKPGQWHKFHTLNGAVVEEISTTHYNGDSYYEDPKIAKLERSDRKTNVDNWVEYFRRYHAR